MQLVQQAGQQLRRAAMFQALLGVVLLLIAVAAFEMYIDFGQGQQHNQAAYVTVGFAISGATALVSSWFLYLRRPFATIYCAASWSLIVVGWIALGMASHYRPAWWILATGACLAFFAVTFVVRVRRLAS